MNRGILYRNKVVALVKKFGTTVTLTRPSTRTGTTVTSSSSTNVLGVVTPELIRHIVHMSEVGTYNIDTPQPYNIFFSGLVDVRETDTVTFNGFEWKIAELDQVPLNGVVVYKLARLLRKKPA